MTPDELLQQWMVHHGELSADLRERFLTRSEVADLAGLPRGAVEAALPVGPRLTAILREARRIAYQRDQEVAEALEEFRRKRLAASPPTVLPRATPRPAKARLRCRTCNRTFVDQLSPPPSCHRCGPESVEPVCPSCGGTGRFDLGGRCARCYDARGVAAESAGAGARGPEGVDVRSPDRRKRPWTGQSVNRPD